MKESCLELEAELEEWRDLGAPVFEPLNGLSVTIVTGRLDGSRFERIRKNIVEHVRGEKSRVLVIDLSAAVGGDAEVAKQLVKTVHVAELVGAKCMLVGIDSVMAQALEPMVDDLKCAVTFSGLEAGMGAALAYIGYEVVRKSNGGTIG